MIDCHNHLADKNFDHDRDEVIERAKKVRVLMPFRKVVSSNRPA